MIDLTLIGKDFVTKHGSEKTQEVTGKNAAKVAQWETSAAQPTAEDLTKMLAYDPDPIHAVKPLYEKQDPAGSRLAILMVTNRAVQPATMESVMRLFESNKMQFIRQTTNFLTRGRNQAAHRFLQSGCEWSFWVDDDMILPCGDAAWFKQVTQAPNFPDTYAGLNTIGRLLHQKKNLIGGCYFTRNVTARAQFNEAALSTDIDRETRSGPKSEVKATKWVANGCLLVHRSVYTDIAAKFPEIALPQDKQYLGYKYGFFDPLEPGMGEDVSFCLRAERAGHQPFVDLSVMPAHIGQFAFNYFNTKP